MTPKTFLKAPAMLAYHPTIHPHHPLWLRALLPHTKSLSLLLDRLWTTAGNRSSCSCAWDLLQALSRTYRRWRAGSATQSRTWTTICWCMVYYHLHLTARGAWVPIQQPDGVFLCGICTVSLCLLGFVFFVILYFSPENSSVSPSLTLYLWTGGWQIFKESWLMNITT